MRYGYYYTLILLSHFIIFVVYIPIFQPLYPKSFPLSEFHWWDMVTIIHWFFWAISSSLLSISQYFNLSTISLSFDLILLIRYCYYYTLILLNHFIIFVVYFPIFQPLYPKSFLLYEFHWWDMVTIIHWFFWTISLSFVHCIHLPPDSSAFHKHKNKALNLAFWKAEAALSKLYLTP